VVHRPLNELRLPVSAIILRGSSAETARPRPRPYFRLEFRMGWLGQQRSKCPSAERRKASAPATPHKHINLKNAPDLRTRKPLQEFIFGKDWNEPSFSALES
jgi:hypothetical protein